MRQSWAFVPGRGWAAPILAALTLTLGACATSDGVIRPAGQGIAETTVTDSHAADTNIASLTDVIKRNPSSADAYNTRGVAYARIGRYPEATEDFTAAIRIDPNNFAAYTNRALAYRQSNRNDLARIDFDRALAANPNHAPALIGRANLLRSQGNLDQAKTDLDTAIRLNPENAQAFHARGLIHQKLGDNARAVSDFDNAIDRDPFAAAPYQARGESLVNLGKYDKAIEDFNAALNVDSKNPMSWAWLGLAYERSGNRAKAKRSLSARAQSRSGSAHRQARLEELTRSSRHPSSAMSGSMSGASAGGIGYLRRSRAKAQARPCPSRAVTMPSQRRQTKSGISKWKSS